MQSTLLDDLAIFFWLENGDVSDRTTSSNYEIMVATWLGISFGKKARLTKLSKSIEIPSFLFPKNSFVTEKFLSADMQHIYTKKKLVAQATQVCTNDLKLSHVFIDNATKSNIYYRNSIVLISVKHFLHSTHSYTQTPITV